ncbi:hypothetical protein SUGI_0550210 [Cryptomeria japonica]|nr:hypothetical protein SUGI_0550210 [Cryptomeria japonica]
MVAKTEEREVFRGLQENEAGEETGRLRPVERRICVAYNVARPAPSRKLLRGGGDRVRLVSQSNDNLPLLTVEGLCTACPSDRQSSRPAYPRTLTFYKKFIRHELD